MAFDMMAFLDKLSALGVTGDAAQQLIAQQQQLMNVPAAAAAATESVAATGKAVTWQDKVTSFILTGDGEPKYTCYINADKPFTIVGDKSGGHVIGFDHKDDAAVRAIPYAFDDSKRVYKRGGKHTQLPITAWHALTAAVVELTAAPTPKAAAKPKARATRSKAAAAA